MNNFMIIYLLLSIASFSYCRAQVQYACTCYDTEVLVHKDFYKKTFPSYWKLNTDENFKYLTKIIKADINPSFSTKLILQTMRDSIQRYTFDIKLITKSIFSERMDSLFKNYFFNIKPFGKHIFLYDSTLSDSIHLFSYHEKRINLKSTNKVNSRFLPFIVTDKIQEKMHISYSFEYDSESIVIADVIYSYDVISNEDLEIPRFDSLILNFSDNKLVVDGFIISNFIYDRYHICLINY